MSWSSAIPTDQVYTQNLTITDLVFPLVTGGAQPYTYSLSPTPPAGLSFNAITRTLSGTPTTVTAATPYTYQAQDATGAVLSLVVTIAVVASDILVLPEVPDQLYTFGDNVSFAFDPARGGVPPYTYTFAFETDLPSGLTYDATQLQIRGTVLAAQAPTQYTFTVSDATQQTVTQSFFMEVQMTLAAIEDQQYVVEEAIPEWTLPPSGGGTNPQTYDLSPALPAGLGFDELTRRMSGTPSAGVPVTSYTYTVTDAAGLQISQTFELEVRLALATIASQSFVMDEPIVPVELPAARGGTDPHQYTLTPAPPSGLVFNAATRILSGTPTRLTSASSYQYSVVDANGAQAERSFTMEVIAAAVHVSPVADRHFVVGSDIGVIELPAATGGIAPWRYAITPALPPGIEFDPASRTLSGTPTEIAALTTYQYTVQDSAGDTFVRTFRVQVHPALTIASIQDLYVAVGTAIRPVTLPAATGGLGAYTYQLSPAPPPGIIFDETTRTLSGAPSTVSAPRDYTYTVVDAGGHTAEQTFQIAVYGALSLPALTDQSYTAGAPITDLSLPSAFGGSPPYLYTLTPALPPGLSFDASSRTLTGTPTTALVPTTYTYTVTDAAGVRVAESFQVEVRLGLGSIADQTYVVGVAIPELTLPLAVGGTDPHTYQLSPAPPPGLSLNVRTLTGTPTSALAPTTYTYTVTDAAGFTAAQTFGITVTAQALSLASVPNQTYTVSEPIPPLELPAARGGTPAYSYLLRPDPPPGLSFDELTRTLQGTPTAILAQTEYTYGVTDQAGTTATQTFTITVGTSSALLGDRAALIALYKATDGPNWTEAANWLTPPEDQVSFTPQQLNAWYGVTVTEGRVQALELPANNLRGILPPELKNLTALKRLQLPDNQLQGPIPAELENLRQLHLQNNQLEGSLPDALAMFTKLRQLWLFGNQLSGPIPAALGALEHLQGLLLSDNNLSGTIPSELGQLASMRDLWLQGNELSGEIPSELGQLDSLRTLLLSDNQVSGMIPPVLGSLPYLQALWLQGNELGGEIPSEFGQLDSLRALLLDQNQLSGTIPSALGGASNLRWLQLHENVLEGRIPESLSRLVHLERLQLSGNRLTGGLPHVLGQLRALEYLYVHENQLSGPLPLTLVDLGSLREFFFDGPLQELCAPMEPDIRAWLATLTAVRGPDCGAPALNFEVPCWPRPFTKARAKI